MPQLRGGGKKPGRPALRRRPLLVATFLVATASPLAPATAADGPDLAVTQVGKPPLAIAPGGSFDQTETTTDVGTAAVGASTTRYLLSVDPVASRDDARFAAARPVPALSPGGSSVGTVRLTIPAGVTGARYLIACADAAKVIVEAAESNNCRTAANTITVTTDLPNLYPYEVGASEDSAPQGGPVNAYARVINVGSADAIKSVVRWYLSTDSTFDAADRPLVGDQQIPGLHSGSGQVRVNSPVTVSVDTPPGTYVIFACADVTGAVAETDENDNCSTRGELLTVTSAGRG